MNGSPAVFRCKARLRHMGDAPNIQRPWLEKVFAETVGLLSHYVRCAHASMSSALAGAYGAASALRRRKLHSAQYACLISCLFVLAALRA